jgi:competence ComEA-like helix-hairpin-helix protein
MPQRDPSLEDRLLIGGMLGAGLGAVVGLGVFGGILFVPVLLTIAGAFVGVSIAGGDRMATGSSRRRRPAGARPRAAWQAMPSVRRPSWPGMPALGRRSRSAATETARRPRVTGPVRISAPRPDLPPVDVNTGDVEDLTRLPGVGRAAAARIVAHRERHGPFRSLRDIEGVEGFDQARVARLAPRAILSAPPPTSPDGAARDGEGAEEDGPAPISG